MKSACTSTCSRIIGVAFLRKRSDPEVQEVDLNEVIRVVLEVLSSEATTRGVVLLAHSRPPPVARPRRSGSPATSGLESSLERDGRHAKPQTGRAPNNAPNDGARFHRQGLDL